MELKTKKFFVLALVLFFLVIPATQAHAACANNPFPSQIGTVTSQVPVYCSASDAIAKAINILLGLAGAVAVLFIILGGFWYLTSAGNEEQAEKGRKTLVNSLIGLVVIIMSFAIVRIVVNTVTGGSAVNNSNSPQNQNPSGNPTGPGGGNPKSNGGQPSGGQTLNSLVASFASSADAIAMQPAVVTSGTTAISFSFSLSSSRYNQLTAAGCSYPTLSGQIASSHSQAAEGFVQSGDNYTATLQFGPGDITSSSDSATFSICDIPISGSKSIQVANDFKTVN